MKWDDIKYFKPEEFDSPDLPGSGALSMNLDFVKLLDQIREKVGEPIKITSGFRTYAHNRVVGGQLNSAHLRGYAADLFCGTDNFLRYRIITAAFAVGITRLEVAPAHVHVDTDPNLPKNIVVFLAAYPAKPNDTKP